MQESIAVDLEGYWYCVSAILVLLASQWGFRQLKKLFWH